MKINKLMVALLALAGSQVISAVAVGSELEMAPGAVFEGPVGGHVLNPMTEQGKAHIAEWNKKPGVFIGGVTRQPAREYTQEEVNALQAKVNDLAHNPAVVEYNSARVELMQARRSLFRTNWQGGKLGKEWQNRTATSNAVVAQPASKAESL